MEKMRTAKRSVEMFCIHIIHVTCVIIQVVYWYIHNYTAGIYIQLVDMCIPVHRWTLVKKGGEVEAVYVCCFNLAGHYGIVMSEQLASRCCTSFPSTYWVEFIETDRVVRSLT